MFEYTAERRLRGHAVQQNPQRAEAFQITPAESDYIRSCYTLAQPSEYYKKKNIFQLVFVVSLVCPAVIRH